MTTNGPTRVVSSVTGTEAWAPRNGAAPTRSHLRAGLVACEEGQAAVEFGLIVPLVCFLVWALVEFGLALNYYLDATHLANEGARLAAVVGNAPQPSGDLKLWIQQQGGNPPPQVCIDFRGSGGQIGDPVQVTVSRDFAWIPFIGHDTLHIKGESTMRLEQLPAYGPGCTS